MIQLALIGGLFLAWVVIVALFTPRIDYKLHRRLDCASKEFLPALQSTTHAALHQDSRFDVLTNASQFYPAMLEAIHGAQASINMECYIFRNDAIGGEFMQAFVERARVGVTVTLVVDAMGSFWFGITAVRRMRNRGVRVQLYQRVKWYRLARLNNRTHRELLIVDARWRLSAEQVWATNGPRESAANVPGATRWFASPGRSWQPSRGYSPRTGLNAAEKF